MDEQTVEIGSLSLSLSLSLCTSRGTDAREQRVHECGVCMRALQRVRA